MSIWRKDALGSWMSAVIAYAKGLRQDSNCQL